jgi:sigma-B regulation protein RsbQ
MGAHVLRRNNVTVSGPPDGPPMIFAHGFGCDQNMWRLVAPAFEADHKVILFDYLGHGQSDRSAYDRTRYATLDGYADDLLQVCDALAVSAGVLVAHSVSAIIGLLAAAREPARFARLVLLGPSPRYVNDGDYVGGFTREDIDGLLDFLDANHLGWSSAMAPTIMGNPDRPALAQELANSFCRTDPEVAKQFARVTFLSDNREDLGRAPPVRSLVIQCRHDAIAPTCVGEFVHRNLPGSELVVLDVSGHCPHLSAPRETVAAIKSFLAS